MTMRIPFMNMEPHVYFKVGFCRYLDRTRDLKGSRQLCIDIEDIFLFHELIISSNFGW